MSKTIEADMVAGAGTHRDTHTAAICDGRGRVLSQLQVPVLRISEVPHCRSLEFPRGRAGAEGLG